jgi:hypothetical protein
MHNDKSLNPALNIRSSQMSHRTTWIIWNVVAADGWNLLLQQQLLHCVIGVTSVTVQDHIISPGFWPFPLTHMRGQFGLLSVHTPT